MPRQPRIEFPGACYHIMARGNRKEFIFRQDKIKMLLIKTLGEAATRYGWRVHAYSVMDNHYHFLLETPEPNLVAGMTWFQTAFTVRCNHQTEQSGHVFEGRYKSILVQSSTGSYFSRLATYIHLNPARAEIYVEREANFLRSHRWTSLYWLTKEPRECPSWYESEQILSGIPHGVPEGREQKYLQLMEEIARNEGRYAGCSDDSTRETMNITLSRGWVYGDTEFRERMKHLISGSQEKGSRKTTDLQTAEWYMGQAEKAWGVTREEILLKRKSSPEKVALGMILKENSGLSHQEIAELLRIGHPTRSASLINNGLKKKNDSSPCSIHYRTLSKSCKKS